MLSLRHTLSRLGEEQLSRWLGATTVDLLSALDIKALSPLSLADLVVSRFGDVGILSDARKRKKILRSLKKDEARNLCLALSVSDESPWETLQSLRFTKSSRALQTLFEVFEVSIKNELEVAELPPHAQNITPQYALFPHQDVACRGALKKLAKSGGRVILHMPTGAGKTRTAMNIIANFLRGQRDESCVVIWLAFSEELCEQAATEFVKAWSSLGNKDISLHRHFGPHRVDLSNISSGFLVMGLGLAYQSSFNDMRAFFSLGKRTKLVIMDEAHQAIAETYSHVLDLLAPNSNVSLLGLTATPGRSWLDVGEDLRLAEFFNRQIETLKVENYDNPITFLQDEGYLATVCSEPLSYHGVGEGLGDAEITEVSKALDISPRILGLIGDDTARNLLIVHRIMEEASVGSKIIVFGCSVEHAEMLATILCLKGLTAAAITSKTHPLERRTKIEAFRSENDPQILTNFGVLTTGFDAPKADVAVITRPTQSLVLYSQMVGRVARGTRAGGTETCKVITVIDERFGFRDLGESFVFWEDLWEG